MGNEEKNQNYFPTNRTSLQTLVFCNIICYDDSVDYLNDKGGTVMATTSFYQNVVIRDKKKIKEIRNALNSSVRPCSEAQSISTDETEQKEIAKKWFSSLKK